MERGRGWLRLRGFQQHIGRVPALTRGRYDLDHAIASRHGIAPPLRRDAIPARREFRYCAADFAKPDEQADARIFSSSRSDPPGHRLGALCCGRCISAAVGPGRGARGRSATRPRGRCLGQREPCPGFRAAEARLCGRVPQSPGAQRDPLRITQVDRRHDAAVDRAATAGARGAVDGGQGRGLRSGSSPRHRANAAQAVRRRHLDQRRHRLFAAVLAQSPFTATRRTIDVSGDGANNIGRPASFARDEAVKDGDHH